MPNLNDYFYFVQIVQRGGFTAAGRALGMPKSTLSHRMRRLESALGVRLLNRNSRHFAPTTAGEELYQHALSLVRAAEEAETSVRRRSRRPSGVVRFSAAIGTAQFALRELVLNFMAEYPEVSLAEQVTSRQVDLFAENIDVAIRAHSGPLPDSGLVHHALAKAPWVLVAGTGTLKGKRAPRTPQDLERFPSLAVWRANIAPQWHLRPRSGRRGDLGEVAISLTPRLLSNDLSALKRAAAAGLGIAALPAYLCRDEVDSGQLTHVLPRWIADESTFTALLPHRRGMLPAVRTFVDYLAHHMPNYVES